MLYIYFVAILYIEMFLYMYREYKKRENKQKRKIWLETLHERKKEKLREKKKSTREENNTREAETREKKTITREKSREQHGEQRKKFQTLHTTHYTLHTNEE